MVWHTVGTVKVIDSDTVVVMFLVCVAVNFCAK